MKYLERNLNRMLCARSISVVNLILAMYLLLVLTACSNSGQQQVSKVDTDSSATGTHTSETEGTNAGSSSIISASSKNTNIDINVTDVVELGPYSDGLAWVRYKVESGADGVEWAGFANGNGEVQFKFEFKDRYHCQPQIPKYEDGVAFVDYYTTEDGKNIHKCFALNDKGENLGSFKNVVAHGSKSVITVEYKDGFESTSFTYNVLDESGNVKKTFERKGNEPYEVKYCGKGVFAFGETRQKYDGGKPMGNRLSGDLIYSTKANAFIELDFKDAPSFNDSNDKALFSMETKDGASSVTLLTDEGEVEEIDLGNLGGSLYAARLNGDILTLRVGERDSRIYSYGIKSGEMHELESKYADVIELWNGGVVGCGDGRYVCCLKGADGKNYVGIFDTSWNPIVEPFKAESAANTVFSDERVLLRGDSNTHIDIYNTEGQLVFDLDSSGSSVIGDDYSDGKLCYADKGTPYCYDQDGKLVFNEIVDQVEHDIFWDPSNEICARRTGDCYGMTSSKFYSAVDGSLYSETTYSRDSRGLVESRTDKNYKDGKESTTLSTYTYDSNGNESSRTVVKDGVTNKYTCTPQADSSGKLSTVTVKNADKGTVSTLEYKYYPDGSIKQYSQTQDGTANLTQEFDEYGMLTVQKDPTYRNEMLSWELDGRGRPVSVSVVLYKNDDIVKINEFTFDTDDAGNITKEYIDGQLYAEFTYEKIGNPADIVRAWGQVIRPGL